MQKYSANQIVGPLVIVAGLGVALMMGRWVASGRMMMPALIIGGIFGAIFFLTLGRLYWYMIPFALASGLPAIPLGGRTIELGELFVAACTAIFVARVAMKRDRLVVFRLTHIPIILSFAWICLVWSQNPTGFVFFGSGVMGARSYLKIGLAFCAFIVLASQSPTDKDFERIIVLVFIGILANAAWGLFQAFFLGGPTSEATANLSFEGYTWHQILAGPALICVWYLLARFKISELFTIQRPWGIALYMAAAFLAMLSGKRMALALVLIAPFIAAILHKEYGKIWLGALVGLITTSIIILGHGTIFTLPYTAQRALSWIPAEWDISLQTLGTGDTFREQLREYAMDEIKQNPWIGKGYALQMDDIMASLNMQSTAAGVFQQQAVAYAMGRAWHNRWLGYTADFGIPFTAMLPFIYLIAITLSYKLSTTLPHGTGRRIFAIYAFLFTFQQIVTSHTSGHSANDAFATWWVYGLLFALYAQETDIKSNFQMPPNHQLALDQQEHKSPDMVPGAAH
jgi:hypothetical protein